MDRIRLPLAALILFLLAGCEAASPTAPVDTRQLNESAVPVTDSASYAADRGGTAIGSGN